MKPYLIASAALAALSVSCPSLAQTAQAGAFNVENVTPLTGRWSYRSYAGGSEAAFADAGGTRLTIRCNRAVRTVSIMRTAVPAATGTLSVWTSALSRSVSARYDLSRVLTADVAITDPLLDAISLSRGKFATSALGAPMAAYPSWAEPTRVIEDCRS
ncbi:MAG: hypothetical protein M3428_01845 [Pseudomonadota bacterium]|jgi:hypothetical protein|nr:hypothetical protein [Sphingomonas sp.]MDQ3471117.1 hypothetical protein [Pseudomonadota bacterium]